MGRAHIPLDRSRTLLPACLHVWPAQLSFLLPRVLAPQLAFVLPERM